MSIGFTDEQIDTGASTRAARLKWVVIVNEALPAGLAVNAAVCTAAATAVGVAGITAEAVQDADGEWHPGLPWIGCTVLVADTETLRDLRAKAAAHDETFVADMPAVAQQVRVYDEYRAAVQSSHSAETEFYALSIVGPRNKIDRWVGRLPLMP